MAACRVVKRLPGTPRAHVAVAIALVVFLTAGAEGVQSSSNTPRNVDEPDCSSTTADSVAVELKIKLRLYCQARQHRESKSMATMIPESDVKTRLV